MKIKQDGKVLKTKVPKAKTDTGETSFTQGAKPSAKLPRKPPKKERY